MPGRFVSAKERRKCSVFKLHAPPLPCPEVVMAFDLLESGDADLLALHHGERTFTRGELRIASRRAASFLHELGVRRGDTIAVWLPDGGVWLQLFFAAAQLGALMVQIGRAHV